MIQLKINYFLPVVLLSSTLLFEACGNQATTPADLKQKTVVASLQLLAAGLQTETRTSVSGNHYTIIYKDSADLGFTLSRPDKNDPSCILCIAAAFTEMNTGRVDGACSIDGKIISNRINPHLGGGILLDGKNCDILPFKRNSDTLDASFLKRLDLCKCSFFQQIQLVIAAKPEHFIDTKLFQRRALVILKDKQVAIIESTESITLATFSADLVELGAVDAFYTDMGDWDEGWYRSKDGGIKVLGTARTQTMKQSNWLYFKR